MKKLWAAILKALEPPPGMWPICIGGSVIWVPESDDYVKMYEMAQQQWLIQNGLS